MAGHENKTITNVHNNKFFIFILLSLNKSESGDINIDKTSKNSLTMPF
jgi:hypothetical protein